ncbi:MAG: hypothetical protein GQ527_03015 [Bacteroidales bacterium]|nr:hypothetical protein [Bacteroidales bacterium]
MSSIQEFYKKREQHYKILSDKYSGLSRQLSIFRLLWFILWFLSIWFVTRFDMTTVMITIALGLIGFIILVVYHNNVVAKKKSYELYLMLNSRELKALNHDVSDIDNGAEFIDENHFYTHDLDIFGSYSLFQYLNRCFSQQGKGKLANSLAHGLMKKQGINEQQEAIDELSGEAEWIQDFQVLGQLTQMDQHKKTAPIESLTKWAKREGYFSHMKFKIGIIVIPIMSVLVFFLLIAGSITATIFMLYLVVPLGFSAIYAKRINSNHMELGKQTEALQRWKDTFDLFEEKNFESSAIQNLQNQLKTEKETASFAIRNLATLSQAFDTRLNLIGWILLNYFFSWDILQSIRLEKWRKKYGKNIDIWFQSLATLESLISLATFKYNHPQMIFPEIVSDGFTFKARNAAHPLLSPKGRVSNDIDFSNFGNFTIVTGANMAGKSTYLRTVGANMILALCGAPVCASEMAITPIQLFTSIRTKDSLAKNESYFYAELLRLQAIIEELKSGTQLFIILDEILKGTNSKDKEMGSKALVAQLINLKAVGLIATHDLQLGNLIETFPSYIQNSCFEVDIHDDQLHFDYKLRDGVSQNLNATFLMNKMGITGG